MAATMQAQAAPQPQFVPFEQRALLTVNQAVQFSGLGRTRLYAALKSGRVTAKKHGRRTLVDRRSLAAFIDSSLMPYVPAGDSGEATAPAPITVPEQAQRGHRARPPRRARARKR
jgi:hypothetical protein